MFTIGQLAKRYSLSRSTLLYYDAKGLLKPSGRTTANYRLYSPGDAKLLERILLFRNAGIPLATIGGILDKGANEIESALEQRLFAINSEIQQLRNQQRVIVDVIQNQSLIEQTGILTKEKWVAMLAAAGLDEEGMWAWHAEFERTLPAAHQDFLESLGIAPEEIDAIREYSKNSKNV